jgi:hypothetical protein
MTNKNILVVIPDPVTFPSRLTPGQLQQCVLWGKKNLLNAMGRTDHISFSEFRVVICTHNIGQGPIEFLRDLALAAEINVVAVAGIDQAVEAIRKDVEELLKVVRPKAGQKWTLTKFIQENSGTITSIKGDTATIVTAIFALATRSGFQVTEQKVKNAYLWWKKKQNKIEPRLTEPIHFETQLASDAENCITEMLELAKKMSNAASRLRLCLPRIDELGQKVEEVGKRNAELLDENRQYRALKEMIDKLQTN